MITVIRDSAGNIKTYSESDLEQYNVTQDETFEKIDTTMIDYAGRFKLSVEGFEGQYFSCHATEFDVVVYLTTNTKATSIAIEINGLVEPVEIKDGIGKIILSADVPGMYVIQPFDRSAYCSAGNGIMVVEVLPNE